MMRSFASFGALPRDDGLAHAELIDPVPDGFERLIDGRVLDAFDLGIPQRPQNAVRSSGRLDLCIGREVVKQLLHLLFDIRLLERKQNFGGLDPLHGFDGNLFLNQQVLRRHDRTVHGDLHRPLLFDFQDQVNTALKVKAERDALIGENRPQPFGQFLVQRLIGRKKKYNRAHHHGG